MMVREIRGAKINPKSSFKKLGCAKYAGAEITQANTVLMKDNTVTGVRTLKLTYLQPCGFFQIVSKRL